MPVEEIIAELRWRGSSKELKSPHKDADGTEYVFCGEVDGQYVGWHERLDAIEKGYSFHSQEDPFLLEAADALERAEAVAQKVEDWRCTNDPALDSRASLFPYVMETLNAWRKW